MAGSKGFDPSREWLGIPAVEQADPETPQDFEIRLRRPPRRRSAAGAVLPAILSILVATAAVVAAYVVWPQTPAGGRRAPRRITAESPRPPRPEESSSSEPQTPTDPGPARAAAAGPPDRDDQSVETQPEPAAVAAPLPQRSDPQPTNDDPPPPEPEQPASVAARVDTSLRSALASLRRGDFDTAEREITAANRLAEADRSLADRTAGWLQLAAYARQFAAYRDKALLAAHGDCEVDGTLISIVESTPVVFKYKAAGRMVRVPPAEVPRPIANAIARRWFAAKDQPGNHVFLGCDRILHDPPDVDGARQEWAVAKQGGENTTLLEPLLDDPLIRDAARQ